MHSIFVTLALASLLGIAGPSNPLWNLLESLWPPSTVSVGGTEKAGATADPNGSTGAAPEGAGADPDGLSRPAYEGGSADANG
jgi:hypothetical protein